MEKLDDEEEREEVIIETITKEELDFVNGLFGIKLTPGSSKGKITINLFSLVEEEGLYQYVDSFDSEYLQDLQHVITRTIQLITGAKNFEYETEQKVQSREWKLTRKIIKEV